MIPLTVLIIDEDRRHAARLRGMLEAEGADAIVAENARDGLRQAYAARPDVILAQLSGFEDLAQAEVPIVLLAKAHEADYLPWDRMEAAGVRRVLFKPVGIAALVKAIGEGLKIPRREPAEARVP